jgi:hypothetical protein
MDELIDEVERLGGQVEDNLIESWIEVLEMELVKTLAGPCHRRAMPTPPEPQKDYRSTRAAGVAHRERLIAAQGIPNEALRLTGTNGTYRTFGAQRRDRPLI